MTTEPLWDDERVMALRFAGTSLPGVSFSAKQEMITMRDAYEAELSRLRAELAAAKEWRTRWKKVAHRKRQHHLNALAALAHNITAVSELQQANRELIDKHWHADAELAAAKRWMPVADGVAIQDRQIGQLRGFDVEVQSNGSVWAVGDIGANMRCVVRLYDNERLCRLAPADSEKEQSHE